MAIGTLTGQTIANTYKSLLKITGTSAGGETLHSTAQKEIEDGDGNPFPFSAAQDALFMTINKRLEFGNVGEYIYGDGTNLTIASSALLNLTATSDVVIPVNVGLKFGDGNQHIETNNTDLTITSDVSINLSAPQIDLLVDTNFVTTGGVNGMSIDGTTFSIDGNSNRVGIGTASPATTLNVVSGVSAAAPATSGSTQTSGTILRLDGSDAGVCDFGIQSGGAGLWIQSTNQTNHATNYPIRLNENGGNVGIGTASPDTKLEIEGTGDPSLVCQIKATAMTDTDYAAFTVKGTGNSVENISRFGVIYENNADTDAPTSYMRLDPSDGTANFLWSTNGNVFMISTTSTNIGSTGGTIVGSQSSDERLKDISSDAFPYGLTQVNAITPIKYQLKNDPHNKNRLGFGAQTIQSIIPESVYDTGKCIDGYDVDNDTEVCTPKSDNTDYELAMEYVQIIPVLVKAVQELSASNDALKARIVVLEG